MANKGPQTGKGKMNLHAKFDFHNVGQGLFHTGKIGDFNFVFDCGSMNQKNVHKSIPKYKKEDLSGNLIDMLVISHFDKDHVNGLDKLLNGVKVEYAIIPYYSPFEKLLLAYVKRNYPKSYFDYLIDPVNYLFEKGVKTVILVTGDEEQYPLESNSNINDMAPWKLENNINNTLRIVNEKEDINDILKNAYQEKENPFFDYWYFKFYHHKIPATKVKSFIKCLQDNKISFKSGSELQKHVKNLYHQKTIHDCYKNFVKKDLNFTSLAMYHGPICPYVRKNYAIFNSNKTLSGLSSIPLLNEERETGYLLTGDICLKINKKYDEFKNHFNTELNKVTLFQIPHHGSFYSWNKRILFDFKKCSFFVASAGISGSHPHPDVISDILTEKKNFAWSNEYNKITIKEELSFLFHSRLDAFP